MKDNIWIGLICISGKPDNPILDGCLGAYVNTLAWAENIEEFHQTVSINALKMNLHVEEILWAEPIEDRLRKNNIDDYLIELANEIETKGDCRFGIFHAWEEREH